MASIVTLELIRNDLQGTTERKIQYKFTLLDNFNANEFVYYPPKVVPIDFDHDTEMLAISVGILEEKALDEDRVQEDPDFVIDSLVLVLNPQWSTSKRLAKKLIYLMMRERDPRLVIWLEPLIVYLRTNYTTQQLSNFLDLTVDQLIKMNRRINTILSDVGTVKDQLVLFDADAEEIE